MNLTLKPVYKRDYRFLYNLLAQRPKSECISHKMMPIYRQHCQFWNEKPYPENYIIYRGKIRIGLVYVTKLNEVAVHLVSGYGSKHKEYILSRYFPRVRYANVSPNDLVMQEVLDNLGFKLIQLTYEKHESIY